MQSKIMLLLIAGLALAGQVSQAAAQSAAERRTTVNEGVVGIVSSNITSSMTQFAQDLATALNEKGKLRVLAILGRGSIGNIEDLIYLRGVDLALAQSDVLDFFQRFQAEPGIFDKVRYVAELGREEVHLLARTEISNIDQLQGGRVNFGDPEGGSFMTSSVLFDDLGLQITASSMSHANALVALERGDIDAMLYASSAPIPLFKDLTTANGVHLIDIPPERVSVATYLPAEINSEQYPGLIEPDQRVRTVNIGTVLAAYNWRKDHPRYANVRQFVDSFHAKFATLRSDSYHPAWKQMDPDAEVPGWRRFE